MNWTDSTFTRRVVLCYSAGGIGAARKDSLSFRCLDRPTPVVCGEACRGTNIHHSHSASGSKNGAPPSLLIPLLWSRGGIRASSNADKFTLDCCWQTLHPFLAFSSYRQASVPLHRGCNRTRCTGTPCTQMCECGSLCGTCIPGSGTTQLNSKMQGKRASIHCCAGPPAKSALRTLLVTLTRPMKMSFRDSKRTCQ